jgi:protein-tyrosine phosphatase
MTTMFRPPNTYWVTEGRFLAGEYPRNIDVGKSVPKLRSLLEVGVTFFVDLTEEGELSTYDQLLTEVADETRLPVEYRRFPIPDVSVPEDAEQMKSILNTIDSALDAGHGVYVHCWGGVGRTGTVAGCWLNRHGHKGPAALVALSERWEHCEKARTRDAPETEAQRQFVLNWRE